ncbi:MAG: hypothetical protein LC808_44290 [Actinobacteria bacterium]|nr:hypothetical protein [Actinomycetota bacterium]
MATFDSWRPVVQILEQVVQAATEDQRKFAETLGLPLDVLEPAMVAGARLSLAIGEILRPSPFSRTRFSRIDAEATERQMEYIEDLCAECYVDVPANVHDYNVASAWIAHLRALRSLRALQHLRLVAGDIVTSDGGRRDVFMVSSISDSGRVNYKGTGGSYPHRLMKLVESKESQTRKASRFVEMANNRLAAGKYLSSNFHERHTRRFTRNPITY